MNPRAATNDLLPFQGSPFGQLGYFSKMSAHYTRYTFSLIPCLSSHTSIFSVVHAHLQGKQKEVHSILNSPNGEGGIRTHAPFRTNGFQDRLVMTTSIPLHIYNSENRLIELPLCNVRYDITCTFPMSRPYFIFYRFFCFFP